jgi:SRSO17 transposase
MLPEIRQSDYLYEVPKFNLDRSEVDNFMHELKGFHDQFNDCFLRSESRDNFLRYMVGQFSQVERKSIEPIAIAVEGGKIRAMQRFMSDAPWDDEKIINKYRNLLVSDLGHPDGVLIFDETGFVKKGDDSIGVAKQYCGTIGKVENCQVGVFASYASPYGYAIVDKRLYIPECWFGDDYREKREKCKLPPEISFKTKPQLAAEMLNQISEEQILPIRYVLGDSVYATSPEFIEAAESIAGLTYMVQMPEDTLCWAKQPVTVEKEYQYRGQTQTKRVLSQEAKKPLAFKILASGIHRYFWYRRTVSEGTKGPITYEFTRRRIVLAKHGLPEREVWLLIRKTLGKESKYSYFISNASSSVRLSTLIWLSGLRWAIEQCFEESKTELGMDHYELRKFPGWHHHMLTCMLAHFFLWHLKIRLGKKSASSYAIAA